MCLVLVGLQTYGGTPQSTTAGITPYMQLALTNRNAIEAKKYFSISNSTNSYTTNYYYTTNISYVTNLISSNYFTTNFTYNSNYYVTNINATNDITGSINLTNQAYGNINLTNTFGNVNISNTFGTFNATNLFGNFNSTNIFGLWNLTNTYGTLNVTNLIATGTVTIITNATALCSNIIVTGNDTDFIIKIVTSAATQQANSNYFTLTMSTAAATLLVPVFGEYDTNGVVAAAYDRWTFYSTANQIKAYTKSTAPNVSCQWGWAVHVGRY